MNTNFTKEEKGENVLLFLHGWGCDGNIFRALSSQLNCTNYLIDFWGFGQSDTPQTAWCVADYAVQLKNFCDQHGLSRVSIIAHSFGARVGVVFASKYPDMVEKLLIVGGAGLRRASIKRFIKVARYKLAKFLSKFGIFCKNLPKGSADYRMLNGTMKGTFVKVVNQNLARYARRICCPTLLVWGKDDHQTPLWMGKKYNKLIANSSLVVLNGGHFVFLEKPTQFALIAKSFLGLN